MDSSHLSLTLKRLGIDTYTESVIYIRDDSHICKAEGFEAQTRIEVRRAERKIIATLNTIKTDLLHHNEAGLSEHAWRLLGANEGDKIYLSHPPYVHSLSSIRSKIYGNSLDKKEIYEIICDIVQDRLSDIHISSFLTACAGGRMSTEEMIALTDAMVKTGDKLHWHSDLVVDKHCVGGLPGNRTTPIIVPIIASFGLTIPKTSSRAITSPAGTANTMEVLTTVQLDLHKMREVVDRENGCMVWGGAVALSPADDMMIRVERALNLDSEGQLVASVLSKKIAAGSTHVVIDIPVGPYAKVRSNEMAAFLKHNLDEVGKALGIHVKTIITDGSQTVGYGIGPALEARDVLNVLQNKPEAPSDLREHALLIAAEILEFSPHVTTGNGYKLAEEILNSGQAWKKFQSICQAQGGLKEIPVAQYKYEYIAPKDGVVTNTDIKRLSLLAKLAGAPRAKAAGIDLHIKNGEHVVKDQPLFTIHAESPGELDYTLNYLEQGNHIIPIYPS